MDAKKWKARNKQIDEKIFKEIKPLAGSLALEFDLNEHSIYGSIANIAHQFQYPKNIFAETNELKVLIERKKELDSVRDLISDERYVVEKQIKQLKREELKINKLFSNFDWQIIPQERIFDTIALNIKDGSISDNLQKRLDDFFGDWGGSECIYMFDDGREISCWHDRDDAEIRLTMNIKEISPKELLRAFAELGIKISFDRIQASITEKRERLETYEDLISEFKT